MKRTLELLSASKWYHYKTLEKCFKDSVIEKYSQKDRANVDFEFVIFKRMWNTTHFIVHPKTKRLKYVSDESIREAGFKN